MSDERPLTFDQVTRKVRVLKMPLPEYTVEACANNIEGTIIVSVVCRASGEVTNVEIIEGLPHGLSERAVEAVKKIKFEPALKEGAAVAQHVRIGYHFTLKSKKAIVVKV
jgi:periplasmic protein TonB